MNHVAGLRVALLVRAPSPPETFLLLLLLLLPSLSLGIVLAAVYWAANVQVLPDSALCFPTFSHLSPPELLPHALARLRNDAPSFILCCFLLPDPLPAAITLPSHIR